MDALAFRHETVYSYADYMRWQEGRWEIIEGTVYDMTPAPSRLHQRISGELFARMHAYFKAGPCEIYAAPFDVRLTSKKHTTDEEILTVVQPDLAVICDKNKLDDRGCLGTPDLIVEIISPDRSYHDLKIKRDIYEKSSVPEYWIFHPTDAIVLRYNMIEQDHYDKADIFSKDESLKSLLFPDLAINLAEIFTKG